jgi:hypothetical protein
LGDRQEYFRIAADGWSRMLANRYAKTTAFRQVTERGLTVLSGAASDWRTSPSRTASWRASCPALWERWERRRS